ncbi:radical SAM protein [Athalassotoga saccharophila]|uniref:radical SAM protein n=1 Tax=Athalassotoga saccharophila TaxID=1441386 RepID=UPI00137B4B96|nr:radical SAM protein [Athalassotoga saccharophila]BBJ27639.1 biotin synthase [Athalassotoga saccharophila]
MRLSYGSARLLGLINSGPPLKMETIYAMFGQSCLFNCAYCTQARESKSSEEFLSRISWPHFEMGEIISAIERSNEIKRICLQVVSSARAKEEAFEFIDKLRVDIPISASVRISRFEEAKEWFDHGIDRIGMATDVVNEKMFELYRGGSLKRHIGLIEEVAKKYPSKVTTHLIVGLGESEREAVEFLQKMHDFKVSVGLFAFTPMKGTKLENLKRPDLDSYRRIQIAAYLLKNDLSNLSLFEFENGRIISFGYDISNIPFSAFKTSGCPNCTRPYYNERPGKEMYNFFEVS